MATISVTATAVWAEVTELGTDLDFILQNQSTTEWVKVRFDSAAADPAPAADAAGFLVEPNGAFIRAGVDGAVYVKTLRTGVTALIVASPGAAA
jgi:hypothetical protein